MSLFPPRQNDPIFSSPDPLVCCPHNLMFCHICPEDDTYEAALKGYIDSQSEEEAKLPVKPARESEGWIIGKGLGFVEPPNPHRVGTGRIIATKFQPPSEDDIPQSLFPSGTSLGTPSRGQFVHRDDRTQALVYTSGVRLGVGTDNVRAGCSIRFNTNQHDDDHDQMGYSCHASFRLEDLGTTGEAHPPTIQRADLRAALAALRFLDWVDEGFHRLVIATSSDYVVEGATSWVHECIQRGWRTVRGDKVKNQDLWECLLEAIERWNSKGLTVQFWRIRWDLNTAARNHAGLAADQTRRARFANVKGVFCITTDD